MPRRSARWCAGCRRARARRRWSRRCAAPATTRGPALGQLPQSAQRLNRDGSIETVSVQRLRPGDRVRVAVGEAFPADGRLDDAATRADESLLSGESHACPKMVGDALVAGSLNLGAPVTMTVQRVGADTRYEAIVALMRQALSQRP